MTLAYLPAPPVVFFFFLSNDLEHIVFCILVGDHEHRGFVLQVYVLLFKFQPSNLIETLYRTSPPREEPDPKKLKADSYSDRLDEDSSWSRSPSGWYKYVCLHRRLQSDRCLMPCIAFESTEATLRPSRWIRQLETDRWKLTVDDFFTSTIRLASLMHLLWFAFRQTSKLSSSLHSPSGYGNELWGARGDFGKCS